MKMNFLRLSILFLFIASSYQAVAQPLRAQTYEQMLEIAQEAAEMGDYYNAREWFQKAYDESRDKGLLAFIAKLSYLERDLEKAEKQYKRLWSGRSNNDRFIDERYMYATVLKENGKYEEAITNYKQFLTESDNEELKKEAKLELDGIMGLNSMEQNLDIAVRFAGKEINSPSAESAPQEYRDGTLYYSSFNRKKTIEVGGEEDDYHAKIYSSAKTDEGYGKPEALGEHINRREFHNSNLSFSPDGRAMYFTRSQLTGSEVTMSKIYVSYRKDEEWSPAVEVEGINGDYLAQHPCPGELYGNDVLFFVSDMEGGHGGSDIYYATANGDGTFKTPTNVGAGINTAGDDITPFYSDGNLYFSSDGLPTIGGFDIFKSSWNGSEWSSPANLGFNYNTSYDDLYYSLNESGKGGYVVSNRPDESKRKLKSLTCCDDIYAFNIREIIIDLLATITDENNQPLNGAALKLKNLTQAISPDYKSLPENHEYQFMLDGDNNYQLVIEKAGYYPDSIKFNTAGIIDDFTVKRTIALKPLPPEPVEDPNDYETVTINQSIRLNNIYYDLDDDKILPDAEQDLAVLYDLLLKYPDMVIELSSHTDSQGKTRYNQQLSERRAQSARNWLLDKGIEPDRIKPVGYGEEQILNRCVNGVKCRDREHRINRRTEFKIIAGPKTIEIKKTVTKGASQGAIEIKEPAPQPSRNLPALEFKKAFVDLGEVRRGDTALVNYEFTNTGSADLEIEVVTACKCTELDWPRNSIKPGEKGKIKVVFDSSSFETGKVTKIVDVIANTEPMINEAKFEAIITE